MRNKTYHNFMRVRKYLMEVKHYGSAEAQSLAHIVFDNVEYDKDYGNHTAEYFMEKIMTCEEFNNQYN